MTTTVSASVSTSVNIISVNIMDYLPNELMEHIVKELNTEDVVNLYVSVCKDRYAVHIQKFLYGYIEKLYRYGLGIEFVDGQRFLCNKIIHLYILRTKNMRLINGLIEWGYSLWNEGLIISITIDSIPMAELFLDKGANCKHSMLISTAVYSDSISMIEFLISRGIVDHETGMQVAAEINNIPLVKFFESKGAKKLMTCLIIAKRGKHTELIEYLERKLLSQGSIR